MKQKPKGTLIIIGGHEDKDGDSTILKEVVTRANQGKNCLVITTVASQLPKEMIEEYTQVFQRLGVRNLDVLGIRAREDARDPAVVERMKKASVVFFTGGDQLRITSQIGDSPAFQCLYEHYLDGGTIAGTSAGAAAMSETMLVSGPSDESHEISALGMARGLGLTRGIVIDSHFAERGRIGRLIGAVAQNPKNLGIGIDEDTAIIVEHDERFRVIGSGAVYVVDGREVSFSSLSEKQPEGILSIFGVKLHVLGADDIYDLANRSPVIPQAAQRVQNEEPLPEG